MLALVFLVLSIGAWIGGKKGALLCLLILNLLIPDAIPFIDEAVQILLLESQLK